MLLETGAWRPLCIKMTQIYENTLLEYNKLYKQNK